MGPADGAWSSAASSRPAMSADVPLGFALGVAAQQGAAAPPGHQHGRDERLAKVEVAVLGALFVSTVLGNAVVLLALFARRRCGGRRKLSRMFYFILHLSVADMITAFFSVLPQLAWKVTYRFQGGNVLCKAVKFGQPLGVYLSSYVLTATALDRYRAICHPLTYCSWTSRRARLMVWAAWTVAVCFSAPQAFIFSFKQVNKSESDCWADFPDWGERLYVTWYACSVFVVPLLVLSFTYSRITFEIWRCAASCGHVPSAAGAASPGVPFPVCPARAPRTAVPCQQAHALVYRFGPAPAPGPASPGVGVSVGGPVGEDSPGRRQRPPTSVTSGSFLAVRAAGNRTNPLISRAKINSVKQSVLVIMFYIVCSGPFVCAQLWAVWAPTWTGTAANLQDSDGNEYLTESGTFYTILTLLFSLNSCVNPWIYLAFNRDLRYMLRLLLSCKGPVWATSTHSSCSSPQNGHHHQQGLHDGGPASTPAAVCQLGRKRRVGRLRGEVVLVFNPKGTKARDSRWLRATGCVKIPAGGTEAGLACRTTTAEPTQKDST